MRPDESLPGAFDPPEQDADRLLEAARTAERVAADQHAQLASARAGVLQAGQRWTGPRFETFIRAAADAQMRIAALADSAGAMSGVLQRYRAVVWHATEEVEALRIDYERQVRVAAEERTTAERAEQAHRDQLASYGISTYGLGAIGGTPQADEAWARVRDAERRAELLVAEATGVHRDLDRRTRALDDEIDALTVRAVPGSDRLSPAETSRRVHETSRLGRPQAGAGNVLAALELLAEVGDGIPVTAIGADGSVDLSAPDDPRAIPSTGSDPSTVASWWGGLADWQREVLIREHPTSLGNLDGLPGRVRDRANRAGIAIYRERMQAVVDAFEATVAAAEHSPRPLHLSDDGRVTELRAKLRALDAVEKVLAKPGSRQLLVLDPDSGHQLHAAVAVGDVDTADHVAVFTPGFRSNVQDRLMGYDDQIGALRTLGERTAERWGDHGSVAAMTWMGYDAPQMVEGLSPGRSVLGPELAETGGKRLAAFFTGIKAARAGHPPHLTALGHSYGSLTTACSLRHKGTGVDDVVVFGSPGLGTKDVGDLRVPAGHLYLAEDEGDHVADSHWFSRDPSQQLGLTQLRTDAVDAPLGHTTASHGHGEYLKEGSTSQYNIAAVVAGLAPDYQLRVPTILDPGAPPDAMIAPVAGDPR